MKDSSDISELAGKLERGTGGYNELFEVVTSFLESHVLGVIVLDEEMVCRVFNKGMSELTGYGQGTMVGEPLLEKLFDEADIAVIREAFGSGEPINNREISVSAESGASRDLIFSMTPKYSRRGKLSGCLMIMTDNTEKKRLRKLLIQSQKMETVGEMAGGIAHDFNNLLEGILGYTTFLMDTREGDEYLQEKLKVIEETARKASRLTARLLSFSGDLGLESRPVDCNLVLAEVEKLLRRTIDKNIIIRIAPSPNLKAVVGSVVRLEQAFLNVCLNARDAMPDGGKIDIRTENTVIDSSYPRLSLNMEMGEYVRVTISDNGIGMTDEVREKVFEPFFTTKKRDNGTGLGLSMVYGIIKNHGGFVNIYSEVGEGSTFSIYLPSSGKRAELEEAGPSVRAEVPAGNGETVLLVDDEPVVRELGIDMLESLGYRVLVAEDGWQGERMFKKKKDEIDIVVLDIVMPGESGGELLEVIKKLSPEKPVLISSGFNRDRVDEKMLESEEIEFIQKPYSMDELGIEIGKLLKKI
ncbi:MAG: response regulator [Candidatus Latescibacteria bacterium]|nr:response regulator [bacterium]MBD3425537.1 response regulator [Candidatus Latescibacterota bacterium]